MRFTALLGVAACTAALMAAGGGGALAGEVKASVTPPPPRRADSVVRSAKAGDAYRLATWSSLRDHAARVPGPRAEDERARGETRTACVAHAFLVRRGQRGKVLAGRAEGEGERLPEVREVFIRSLRFERTFNHVGETHAIEARTEVTLLDAR